MCFEKVSLIHILDKMLLQTLNNHPVHILDNEGHFSPSSFIPFCSFGKEFIGNEINEFDIPVCNIFKPKLHYNQLCYETDLQELKDSNQLMNQLEIGLTLAIDYNEERQLVNIERKKRSGRKKYFNNENQDKQFAVYLETISR